MLGSLLVVLSTGINEIFFPVRGIECCARLLASGGQAAVTGAAGSISNIWTELTASDVSAAHAQFMDCRSFSQTVELGFQAQKNLRIDLAIDRRREKDRPKVAALGFETDAL
jgi:hypothetical protein